MQPGPIARWHTFVKDNDLSEIEDILADDAVFQSPAVHTPQAGKVLVAKYLRAAMIVLNNPTFIYTSEWFGDRSAVLEFEVTIQDIYVNGVDMIRWNADGRIVLFKVMIRPLKALNTIIPLMGQQLQAKRL